jgi:hypothetical protein
MAGLFLWYLLAFGLVFIGKRVAALWLIGLGVALAFAMLYYHADTILNINL